MGDSDPRSTGRRVHEPEPSLGRLLKDIAADSRTLVQKEIQLAKEEISDKATRIGRNVGYLAVGGLTAFAAFLTLLGAASYGLMEALNERIPQSVAIWLAPLIVGGVVAVVAAVLVGKALATLREEGIAPRQTIDSLQENKEWLLNKTRE
jgi:hypothetical protein